MKNNQEFYFRIVSGKWHGTVSLQVTNWAMFWRQRVSYKNRVLTFYAILLQRIFGELTVAVVVEVFPGWGTAGVALIKTDITTRGIKLYSVQEQHVLNPDSVNVYVHSRMRFGPISLRSTCTNYPVRVYEDVSRAEIKNMPLLGALWRRQLRQRRYEGNYSMSKSYESPSMLVRTRAGRPYLSYE
jgi:hypothetical protein